nr:hypothetical protein [Dechloromonas sp.]
MSQKPILTLGEIREEIDEVSEQIERTKAAGLPEAESLASLKATLSDASVTWQKFTGTAADALAAGEEITAYRLLSVVAPSADKLALLGLGAAVAPRLDAVIKEIQTEAKKRDDGRLRLLPGEKAARLLELRRRLYSLEMAEAEITEATGEKRRANCNAAAVLGIPADVAEANKLLTEVE